jgi:hypothetical protein
MKKNNIVMVTELINYIITETKYENVFFPKNDKILIFKTLYNINNCELIFKTNKNDDHLIINHTLIYPIFSDYPDD